jgi:cardiolipin synthase
VGAAARAYYEDVLEAGARLHLYTKGLVHAKTMTIDDSISLIGSSNFDIRSFEINMELSMLLYGADVTRRLRREQLRYIVDSYQLDAGDWSRRAPARKLVDNMARLLTPIL